MSLLVLTSMPPVPNWIPTCQQSRRSSDDFLRMHGLTDHAEGGFEITVGGFEGVGVDGEGSSEDDEGSAVLGALDGLFQTEAADGLHGDFDRVDDLAELVERAGHALTSHGVRRSQCDE